MPMIEWDRDNTKYVLTLLPLAGLFSGAVEIIWYTLSLVVGIHAPLYAAVACGIPVFIHGGIHLDGLADTADACASHAAKEKKREILADPHTGAFGVAGIVFYEMICFGLFCEIHAFSGDQKMTVVPLLLLFSYIIPRLLVLLATAVLPPSAPEGMLYSLTSAADNRLNMITSVELAALCTAVLGVNIGFPVLVFMISAILLFLYFRYMVMKQFDGISGDLCGWLMKVSEAVMLASACVTLGWLL